MSDFVLVRMGELYLKGKNRPFFVKQLEKGLRRVIRPLDGTVERGDGRLIVRGPDAPALARAAAGVFGVHSVSVARACGKDLEAIADLASDLLPLSGGSFRVTVKRGDKRFPMTSSECAAAIGGLLLQRCPGWRVDLHTPDVTVWVELREQAHVYGNTIPGVGGMPANTAGNALLLLSGGIDSPVAGFMMARRGVSLDGVYFHAFPYTSDHALEKVLQLARQLAKRLGLMRVYVVPLGPAQEAIRDQGDASFGTVHGRRMMMRIATHIAQRIGAQALVTGESMGQVASQTMEGMVCTEAVTTIPVFRPLVAMDKQQIMDISQDIGTYDISILPYEDCCTVFTPEHPATKPKLEDVEKDEANFDWPTLMQQAIEGIQMYVVGERIDPPVDWGQNG